MLVIYVLWFLGVLCGLIAAVEIAVVIYRLCNKNKNVRGNIIVAVLSAALCIGLTSSAAISIFNKVIKSNNMSFSDIGKKIGKTSADVTANAYQEFVETWDDAVKETSAE